MVKSNDIRILILDNDEATHRDFNQVFNEIAENDTKVLPTKEVYAKNGKINYIIDSELHAQKAIEKVKAARKSNNPYALAFIGSTLLSSLEKCEMIEKIWAVDANIQIVICLAQLSDINLSKKLENSNDFLIISKPINRDEIKQAFNVLINKWKLKEQMQNLKMDTNSYDNKTALALTKATLESTPEGTIVINTTNNIVIYNEKFLKIWGLSQSDLINENAINVFKKLSKQVEESKNFYTMILNLLKKTQLNHLMNEWNLKNGKVIELYMQPRMLDAVLAGYVLSFKDVTDRKRLEEQLVYQATHDSLTSLPNRILLADRIQQGIVHAKREGNYLSVLLVDLDNFKDVNDTLGHSAGDILLKLVSDRLSNSVRDIDTVIRLGGDEFVVILMSQNRAEDSITKAKEIIEKFLTPFQIEDHSLRVTVSIGISYYPDDGNEGISLLKNADAALYHAKKMGRNTFQVYMHEYNEQLLQRAELNNGLVEAITHNEFLLHYQPLVNPDTGTIIGLEALLRWHHPKLGLLFPQTFISLAEETGLIVPIGDWVLKTACTQIKIWQDAISPDLTIAVNISGHQFAQKNFVERLKCIIEETGIEPQKLELEMCQNYVFRNISETSQKMLQLKELGVRLSIDDFGVGDASFTYLKYFPFDKVKIDKSYIKGIHTNKYDDAIVEAIISMTKKMGMEVIAEGVETIQQIDFLRKHHGQQVQGYYFSSPLDVNKCTELLKSKKSLIAKY